MNNGTGDEPLIGMASPNHCPSCGADMTPDQRYCVECGNRRGKPRFSTERPKAAPVAVAARKAPRRFSASSTLLTGLAVLLLAVGVGVMIGNSGDSTASPKPNYKVVINNGGGGGGGVGTSTSGSSAPSSTGNSSSKKGSSHSSSSSKGTQANGGTTAKISKKAALNGNIAPTVNTKDLHTKKQRQAAIKKVVHTKVKEGDGKTLASQSQKLGGSCSDSTIGCQNGKYTGSWLGG
jgi:hypothetical protein